MGYKWIAVASAKCTEKIQKILKINFLQYFFQTRVIKIQKNKFLPNFFNLRNLPQWKIFAASISYGLGTNHSFINIVFLWPVLRKIRAVWGRVSVAAAWWLIVENIVNYVTKHGLHYFGHKRGTIKETKKVQHLPFSVDLWQLCKIIFFRFFWMRLAKVIKFWPSADHATTGF